MSFVLKLRLSFANALKKARTFFYDLERLVKNATLYGFEHSSVDNLKRKLVENSVSFLNIQPKSVCGSNLLKLSSKVTRCMNTETWTSIIFFVCTRTD